MINLVVEFLLIVSCNFPDVFHSISLSPSPFRLFVDLLGWDVYMVKPSEEQTFTDSRPNIIPDSITNYLLTKNFVPEVQLCTSYWIQLCLV